MSRFGGGVHTIGWNSGRGIRIRSTGAGKLAFLTSRRHDMAEDERIIIACFRIDCVEPNEETAEDTVAAGEIGEGYIEVHHRKPVSEHEGEVQADSAADMAAVCPNCHRMLHLARGDRLTVEKLRAILQARQ